MTQIPNTPIIVDSFKFIPGVYVYLLTHLHSDHTSGLTPSWNNGTIYCSHVTREILLEKFKINPSIVIGLDEDCVHNIPLDSNTKGVTMQLTLIDANHCPGSCMFLMEGYFGTILHTGDFRFDPLILQNDSLRNKKIDHLYLDDTFCSPEYEFPTRAEAGNEILDIISHYPDNYQILIGVDTLGKEELLVAIALRFQTLIVVDEERLRMIQAIRRVIDIPDVFTHDVTQGRVIVLPKMQVNHRRVMQYRLTRPTVGIQPSGWAVSALGKSNQKNGNQFAYSAIHRVAYSLHSSYSELERFVKTLKPKVLYSASKHDNVYLYDTFKHLLSKEKPPPVIIPKSVQLSMEAKKQVFFIPGGRKKKVLASRNISLFAKRRIAKGVKIISQSLSYHEKHSIIDLTDEQYLSNNETYIDDDDDDDDTKCLDKCEEDSDVLEALENLATKNMPSDSQQLSHGNVIASREIDAIEHDGLIDHSFEASAFLDLMDQMHNITSSPSSKVSSSQSSDNTTIKASCSIFQTPEKQTSSVEIGSFDNMFQYPQKKRLQYINLISSQSLSEDPKLSMVLSPPTHTTQSKMLSLRVDHQNAQMKSMTDPDVQDLSSVDGAQKSEIIRDDKTSSTRPADNSKKKRHSGEKRKFPVTNEAIKDKRQRKETHESMSSENKSKSASLTPSEIILSTQSLMKMSLSFAEVSQPLFSLNNEEPSHIRRRLSFEEVESNNDSHKKSESQYLSASEIKHKEIEPQKNQNYSPFPFTIPSVEKRRLDNSFAIIPSVEHELFERTKNCSTGLKDESKTNREKRNGTEENQVIFTPSPYKKKSIYPSQDQSILENIDTFEADEDLNDNVFIDPEKHLDSENVDVFSSIHTESQDSMDNEFEGISMLFATPQKT